MPSIPLALSAAAGALASSAYLNARFSLEHDLLFFGILGSTFSNIFSGVRADRINAFYVLEKRALDKTTAKKPFILFEGKSFTYAETYEVVLRYGVWLREQFGVQKQDIVAINYQNSETYIFLWFAIWAIGAKPAFINYNLQGAALTHSLRASTAKVVIVDPLVAGNMTDEVRQAFPETNFVVFTPEIEAEARRSEPTRYADEVRSEPEYYGMAILIYTSGTTGMPKPAVVSWGKVYIGAAMIYKGSRMRPDDVIYTCMPLYHSSASLMAVGSALMSGATVAIGRRFSTKTFWKEVRETKATIIQYVGETCRYLTVAPPETDPVTGENLDKRHSVRVAVGNGLRSDVWDRFKERFGIDTIHEFYAATEGTTALWNHSRNSFSAGAIGRLGLFSGAFLGLSTAVVKVDEETDLPWRDPATGFCRRVKAGEPGEWIGLIRTQDVRQTFQGYFGNASATESKIMRDVLRKGDAWFRSGDIVRWDSNNRIYFSDRIGDTFRWKSENVSTAEVAQILGTHPAVQEANVYGVQLPNHDGRAGCVAIVFDKPQVSAELLADLATYAKERLPKYAVPLFLRVLKEVGMQTTGTNKQQKHGFRQQSVDPSKVLDDALFWLKDGKYVPFGPAEWKSLQQGVAKL